MSGPLLAALRAATREAHARVEAASPLARTPIDRAAYRAYLASIAGFHLPLEAALYARHDWAALGLPHADARRRAGLLAADLAALGLDAADLPRCPPADDEVASLAAALGAFYVLEGSTLGGQVLARGLAADLDPPPPTAYLVAAGPATAARWRDFRDFAEATAAGSPAPTGFAAAAAASAAATFARLEGWWTTGPSFI